MADEREALEKLIDGILMAVNDKLNSASYDKTVKGRVIENIDGNKYKVEIDGITYTAKSKSTHNVNDIVYILIPQNDYKKLIIIY